MKYKKKYIEGWKTKKRTCQTDANNLIYGTKGTSL